MATLYACSNDLNSAKAYLDLLKQTTLVFVKKREIALLYTDLGNKFKDNETKIECYKLAAENYAKDKKWDMFCEVELGNTYCLKFFVSLTEI